MKKEKVLMAFALLGVLVLSGCDMKDEESYINLDEAMKIDFNESIHQVKKCSFSIYNQDEYLSFVFFGDCGHIKRKCIEKDICDWSVSSGYSCYEQNKCYPNFTGRCICRFEDN